VVVIGGTFNVKPGHRADMVKLATGLYPSSRAENGCLHYSCYQDAGDPDAFLFFEEWESQEAINRHFQMPYFLDFMKRFPDMITGQPIIKLYTVSSVKQF
jgi:quinol monooxygenase YgiN